MLRQPRKSSLKIIVNTGLRSLLLDYHNKSEKNIPSFALCESSRSTPPQWEEVLRDNLNTACKEARGGKGTPLSELRLMTKRHYFSNQSIKNAHISILGWICTGPSSSVYQHRLLSRSAANDQASPIMSQLDQIGQIFWPFHMGVPPPGQGRIRLFRLLIVT